MQTNVLSFASLSERQQNRNSNLLLIKNIVFTHMYFCKTSIWVNGTWPFFESGKNQPKYMIMCMSTKISFITYYMSEIFLWKCYFSKILFLSISFLCDLSNALLVSNQAVNQTFNTAGAITPAQYRRICKYSWKKPSQFHDF